MSETSTTALLVGTPDMLAARADALTATIPRAEIEEALASEPPAEMILEILRRPEEGEEVERRTVNVSWAHKDLERVLDVPDADAIRFYFDPAEIGRALDGSEVEGHGLREAAVVLSIAAVAAVGAAGNAYAQPDPGGAGTAQATVVSHDEAGLTARGIQRLPATQDEAGFSHGVVESAYSARGDAGLTRGIEAQPVAATHDEAGLTARGIEAQPVAATHDEAGLTARGIEPGTLPATHDEATLSERGIEPGTLPATHDEAGLASRGVVESAYSARGDAGLTRGIEAQPLAIHDEAGLTARGIEPGTVPAIHDEATLTERGIQPETPVVTGEPGSGFDFPSVDPGTAAAVAGALAGGALLIAAAGFATRRRELGHT
jgi:hypothetical protein